MSRRYLLDTNMVSYVVSGEAETARDAVRRLAPTDSVLVSAISEAELRFGMAKAPGQTVRIARMERFLAKAQVLAWGHEEALVYGELRARLEAQGKPLGPLDLLIAAHALAVDATLVTHDAGFSKLNTLGLSRSLQIVDWLVL